MPKKGISNNPAGKPKGVQNKVTRDIKEAFKNLVESNLDNLSVWLKQIAKDDPERAIAIIINLSEYVIPKLARTEADITNRIELLNRTVADIFPERVIEKIKDEPARNESRLPN